MAAPRGPALSLVCTTCVWYLCVRVHTSSPHKVVPQHQHSQKACVCRNWLCPTVPVHIPNGDAARDGETAGISSGRQEAEEAVALQQQVQQKKSGSSRTSSTSTNATATSSQQHQLQHQYQHQRQAARQPGSQAARQPGSQATSAAPRTWRSCCPRRKPRQGRGRGPTGRPA